MDLGLSGRVAFVSAASRGIGKACALSLAREGASVALCARDGGRLAETVSEIADATGRRPVSVTADLFEPAEISRFVCQAREALGPPDILIANSIGPRPGTFEELGDEDWLDAFGGAVMATVRLVRAVLPSMIERGGGSVVGIQSTSVKQPIPHLTLSNGLRPGVAGLFKSLAAQYGKQGLRFNLVLPGRILTDRFIAVEREHGGDLDARVAEMAAQVPLGKLGQAEDVADMATFLASDRTSYVTGAAIQVDGGNVRGLF